jgi:hypothetical protein
MNEIQMAFKIAQLRRNLWRLEMSLMSALGLVFLLLAILFSR